VLYSNHALKPAVVRTPAVAALVAAAFSAVLLQCEVGRSDTLPEAKPTQIVSPLRQYLMDLDANHNEQIEPGELDVHAQYYLETITRGVEVPFAEGVSFTLIEAAARLQQLIKTVSSPAHNRASNSTRVYSQYSLYAAQRNYSRAAAADKKSRKSGSDELPVVPGFGIDSDPTQQSPGFGSNAGLKYPYNRDDYNKATSTIRRYDRDNDNALSRKEASKGTWYDRDPFIYDYNYDGKLDLKEFAQRYAKRRIDDTARRSRGRTSSRDEKSSRSETSQQLSDKDRRREEERRKWAGIDRRTFELAMSVISRHDRNRNGKLDGAERAGIGENSSVADTDSNGEISREELARWLSRSTNRRGSAPLEGVPTWFYARDVNNDGQVAMAEFASQWDNETAADFQSYDKNGDGVITSREVQTASTFTGATYANRKAQVFGPGDTIISTIEVDSSSLVGDFDVQLSISHTYDEQLDAHLLAPDGQRIELFTGVGGNDDHFDGTILDDEATNRVVSGRPPFRGRYQPEALSKRQPSLSSFYGKSARGLWQLIITARRADRPGMLHSWAILTRTPAETINARGQEKTTQPAAVEQPSRQPYDQPGQRYRRR